MAATSSIKVTLDHMGILEEATRALLKTDVGVGIPDEGAERKPVDGEKTPPSNAVIGYVQEFGDDEKHIPPRPFLMPGVEGAKVAIIAELVAIGIQAMHGAKASSVKAGFVKIGLICHNAIRSKITEGPFAPLSARTIKERAARGRKGAKQYLKLQGQGVPVDVLNDPGVGLVKPLIDTGQLRNAVTYVLRDKGAR